MRKVLFAMLACLVICAAQAQADRAPTVVKFTAPWVGQYDPIRVVDFTGVPLGEGGIPHTTSRWDVAFVVLPVVQGACNELTKCAMTIEDACEAIGSEAKSARLVKDENGKESCKGECKNGHGVDTSCVSATVSP